MIAVPKEKSKKQLKSYQLLLETSPEIVKPSGLSNKSDDSFCKKVTIERQWVITGKKVNVLFNYAPIGFGGESFIFLWFLKNTEKLLLISSPGNF